MTPRRLETRGWVLVKLLSRYRLEPSYNNNMAFIPPPPNQSDRFTVYFRRVSDVKISEENSECLIDKSHIEFNFTYSLP